MSENSSQQDPKAKLAEYIAKKRQTKSAYNKIVEERERQKNSVLAKIQERKKSEMEKKRQEDERRLRHEDAINRFVSTVKDAHEKSIARLKQEASSLGTDLGLAQSEIDELLTKCRLNEDVASRPSGDEKVGSPVLWYDGDEFRDEVKFLAREANVKGVSGDEIACALGSSFASCCFWRYGVLGSIGVAFIAGLFAAVIENGNGIGGAIAGVIVYFIASFVGFLFQLYLGVVKAGSFGFKKVLWGIVMVAIVSGVIVYLCSQSSSTNRNGWNASGSYYSY